MTDAEDRPADSGAEGGAAAADPEGLTPEGPGDGDPTPRTADRGRRLLLLALVVAIAAAVTLGALAATLAGRLDDERAERRDVADVAGRLASALVTYDYEDLDAAKARVLALATGTFRREYEESFTGGFDALFREAQSRSEGVVTDVFVTEIDGGSASAIVVLDVEASGVAGTRSVFSTYVQLELVQVDGRWLVDGVTSLNIGQSTAEGPATTPTTAVPIPAEPATTAP